MLMTSMFTGFWARCIHCDRTCDQQLAPGGKYPYTCCVDCGQIRVIPPAELVQLCEKMRNTLILLETSETAATARRLEVA